MSIDLLQEKIRQMKCPVMVGIDPTEDVVPAFFIEAAKQEFSDYNEAVSSAYVEYSKALLNSLRDIVPAVKFQKTCFDVLGPYGLKALNELVGYADTLGFYTVIDELRCDAPHIARLYSEYIFGDDSKHYPVNSITLNGYLGSESVASYLNYCNTEHKTVFIMVRSSNKSGREVQDLLTGDRFVHSAMCDLITRWGRESVGKYGYSNVGALIGAYDSAALASVRKRYDKLFIMIVGYGAQGGTAKPVSAAFDALGRGAIVSASRSIIGAWKSSGSDGHDFCDCAVTAAEKMKHDLSKYIKVI